MINDPRISNHAGIVNMTDVTDPQATSLSLGLHSSRRSWPSSRAQDANASQSQ